MELPDNEQNHSYGSEELSNPDLNTDHVQQFNTVGGDKKQTDLDVQCICCGAVLSEEYAIWFRHRYYCCKECLPEETARGFRLGKIIKSGGNYLDRKERRQQKSVPLAGIKEMITSCPTPGCDGRGHVSGKYLSHRGILSCPIAQKETKKKNSTTIGVSSEIKDTEMSKCPTPGCDGSGHVKGGTFSSHRSLYGCPRRNSFSKELENESRGSSDSAVSSPTDCQPKGEFPQSRGASAPVPRNDVVLNLTLDWYFEGSEVSGADVSIKNPAKRGRGRGRGKVRGSSRDELWDITEGDGSVIKLKRKSTTLRCEFPGCNGEGHVTGKFVKHRSLYGCPLAAKLSKETDGCPYPGCDGMGHVVPGLSTHDSLSGCPLVANAMTPSDTEVRCPIPSCDGRGHITGRFSTHRSATACPRAALLLEGRIPYSSLGEEEIVKGFYDKNPESFGKMKVTSSHASIDENIVADDESVFQDRIFQNTPDKNDDSFLTLLKEVKILESVNAEFEKSNFSLKVKVEELETECKSITEDVLLVKTDEEKLRDDYNVLKRKILYALSRVNLSSIGLKQSSFDFDGLIDILIMGCMKQKKSYEVVMKEIGKSLPLIDS